MTYAQVLQTAEPFNMTRIIAKNKLLEINKLTYCNEKSDFLFFLRTRYVNAMFKLTLEENPDDYFLLTMLLNRLDYLDESYSLKERIAHYQLLGDV